MKIVAAAIKIDGFVAMVPAPGRHHHVLHRLADGGYPTPIGGVQGFVTDEGKFVDRTTAMDIARRSKQLLSREGQHGPGGHLFSEDLW